MRGYCQRQGFAVNEWVEEIGSGLNYQRKQFNRVMEEIELGRVQRLIIAHQDRLVRFGFEWFAAFCSRHGTDLVIVNADTLSTEPEIVQDLLAIVQGFSNRLPSLHAYRKVLRDAVMQENPPPGQ